MRFSASKQLKARGIRGWDLMKLMPLDVPRGEQREETKARRNFTSVLAFLFLSITVLLVSGQGIIKHSTAVWTMKTLTTPSRNNIGMDYYHESMGYVKRSDSEIESDLALIQQVTNKIKVYHNPFATAAGSEADSLRIVMNIVQKAKARKMYIVWTENDDNVVLSDANWNEYSHRVIANAAEAYRAGVDEFLVGNEISLHNNGDQGFNDTNLPARIKQLVTDCQTNFPGIKSYEEGWYKNVSWHNATLGPLSKIYFTLYEPWHQFKTAFNQIVTLFGKKAEIGELSTMATKDTLNNNEEEWMRELMRRYDYARQEGIPVWLFTFRETQDNGFGLFHSTPPNQPHTIWNYLVRRVGAGKISLQRERRLRAKDLQDSDSPGGESQRWTVACRRSRKYQKACTVWSCKSCVQGETGTVEPEFPHDVFPHPPHHA